MKRIFLAILLVLSLTVMLYAQDSSEDESDDREIGGKGFDWDIRFGFSLPIVTNLGSLAGANSEEAGVVSTLMGGAGVILSPIVFFSLSLGVGFQYTIIPHVLAPGIYADVHFNLPTWFLIGMFTDWTVHLLLLQPEVRFYNQFQFSDSFGLDRNVGTNFLYIGIPQVYAQTIILMNAGFVMKIGDSFGLEYCYAIPSGSGWTPSIHRIGFSWSLR